MRRAFARLVVLLAVLVATLPAGAAIFQFRQPATCQNALRQLPAGYYVDDDGCLEWRPLPVPRFGTNPGGSTWRLADLKPGSVLRDMDLRGCDWRGVELPRVTFTRCDFLGANLQGANLQGCRFPGTTLADADLRGADLRGADLSTAHLLLMLSSGHCAYATVHARLDGAIYDHRTQWEVGFDPEARGAGRGD